MNITNYDEQIQILKNAAAQKWKPESERKRLIEEAVKLEVKMLEMKNTMKIDVLENGSKSSLVAFLIEDNGRSQELVRTEKGRDDLLNKIDDLGLSYLDLEFKQKEE